MISTAQTLTKTTKKAMFNFLLDLKPDIVYLPSFLDTSKDHFVTNQIFYSALDGSANTDFEIWSYEIWSPTYINRLVPIDFEKKEEAIKAHATQLKSRDYLGAIKALNEYRAKLIKADKHQMEKLHPMGEIQSNEKSDFIGSLSDLIRVNYLF